MLKARILTAVVLLAGLLLALFWFPPAMWQLVIAAAMFAAAWEWGALAGLSGFRQRLYALAIAAIGWSAGSLGARQPDLPNLTNMSPFLYAIATSFWLLLAPIWLRRRPAFRTPAIPLLAGLAVLIPVAAALADLRSRSPALLLAIMAVAWISDTAAYFAGHRYGRRKLAPSVSPGKTWEGVYGAMLAVAIYAGAWLATGGTLPTVLGQGLPGKMGFIILLLVLAAAGIVGDLLESQLKRRAGVKDSGTPLPGHGGVLDRVDALLPVLPLAALIFVD